MTILNTLLLFILLLTSPQCKKDGAMPTTNAASVNSAELKQTHLPLNAGVGNAGVMELRFTVNPEKRPVILNQIEISFSDNSRFPGVVSISANYAGAVKGSDTSVLFGTSKNPGQKTRITGTRELGVGIHFLKFDIGMNVNPDLLTHFQVEKVKLSFKNHDAIEVAPAGKFIFRPKLVVRAASQDKTDTYRIPGLVTTSKGTLIAVYDNRYNNSKDLQEDIDIGMSRSTDGGQTWQPMKVIMDMGEYGGRSQRLNGIGDPCVLYDHKTHTIWVAGLWMSGSAPDKMLWWASKPGMKPEETGQFILVKSTDDGLTWSQPINITSQIKDPAWQLLLQGPGSGITMTDGTLVFPAQFKADLGTKSLDGGQFTCHSTIVYSKDQGKTWQIGTGAKSNTTEAQVVELADGSLMLNMRDDRNRSDKGETNGRAVAVTTDLGKTWIKHASSNSALQEPNCMASIISANLEINGKMQQVLFFSNPDSKTVRSHMTIKASLDGGLTWPKTYQVELNSESGYGYSCMSMVDDKTIGILYEGVKDLYFQKVPVTDLLGNLIKK
ncbi:MAG: sialidase family protein [Bacteroidota bacterium]|nr:sialidase family protein [Bacteroidota bacterium]